MLPQLLLLCVLSGSTPAPSLEDGASAATALLKEKSWEEARRVLERALAQDGLNPDIHEKLAQALMGLGESDAAARRLDIAIVLAKEEGTAAQIKRLTRALEKADPLEKRRSKLRRDATSRLYRVAKKLHDLGNVERALAAIESLEFLAEGKDASKLVALIKKIHDSSKEVDLDEQTQDRDEDEAWPLLVHESEHYVLKANLEQEVVELVADTMDDIHGYYVMLYLDGDESAVSGKKATIRIHANKEEMLGGWSGESSPEGWWSPGQNQVTCYDTRTSTGSLEWMLETLFHEASHQFMTQLARKGGHAPAWLNEGTASFFEGATAMADRRVLWPDAALKRLNSLVSMLSGGRKGPTLREVLSYSGPGSYPGEYYAWGWGIVYFMQQYEDPETRQHSFRPLYSEYREQITSSGGNSMALFEEIFLGPRSPLEHKQLGDFEKDWSDWILKQVAPLHRAPVPERRALRRALVDNYTQAAEAAREQRKPAVSSIELLTRALGHVEYIRTQLDGEENDNDVELIRLQTDILVELERPKAAAPLVERLLELADAGVWEPTEEVREELERLLMKLDRGNWAVRQVISTRRSLTRSVRSLFDTYMKGKSPRPQRALTLASRFGAALGGNQELLQAADELRAELRLSGQLVGIPCDLFAPKAAWETIFSEQSRSFKVTDDSIELSSVRPHGEIQTQLRLGNEYQLRGTLVRKGEVYRSTTHGLVIAASEDSDWLVFGIQKGGRAALYYLSARPGGGVNTRKFKSIPLTNKPKDGDDVQIRVHVRNGQWIRIQVNESEVVQVEYPSALRRSKHVGIYSKDGTTRLENAVVESFD